MKKILSIIIVILIGVGFVLGKNYYNDRYTLDDTYYVYIPSTQSTEIEVIYDDSGKAVDKGRNYEFIGMNKDGDTRVLSFSYSTEDSSKLLQPSSFLKVEASKTIVIGQSVITEKDVPENLLETIKTLN